MNCSNGSERTAKFIAGLAFAFMSLIITFMGIARFIYPFVDTGAADWFSSDSTPFAITGQLMLLSSIFPMLCAAAFATAACFLLKSAATEKQPDPENPEFVVGYSTNGGWKNTVEKISAALNLLFFAIFASMLAFVGIIQLCSGQWLSIWHNGCAWLASVVPLFIVWASYDGTRGHKLVLSKRGVDIDRRGPASAITFACKWFLPWSDLHSITVLDKPHRKKKNKRLRGKLAMDFGCGSSRVFDLSALSKEELDALFQAFERWADKLALSPDVLALKDYVLLGEETARHAGEQQTSFTEIWQASLQTRHASTAYMPLQPGQKLQNGRISVVSQVCSSGLSAVYLAEDKKKQRLILKECFVAPDTNESKRAKAEELFKREAALLARLDHPQIAKLTDVFEENGRSYIVMQHISGTNLRQLVVHNGAQPETVVLAWARQILGVLEYLHTQDPPVIHRDLTPDNLVLGASDSKLTVVDFGAANEYLGKATGTLIGKQCYIAPEQFRGKAQTQSDIYALGATMYFLLTGKDPEPLESSRPADLNPAVSLEVSGLVEWCTNQEAELRPQSAADLKTAIEEMIKQQEAAAKPGESQSVVLGLKNILRVRTREEA